MTTCDRLAHTLHRGTRRDDLRPGLRTFSFERRVTVLSTVDDATRIVTILGVFYGGREFESDLGKDG